MYISILLSNLAIEYEVYTFFTMHASLWPLTEYKASEIISVGVTHYK